MDNHSTNELEQKALNERLKLQETIFELRSGLSDALNVKKNARQHLGKFCALAAVLGLTAGYILTGIFADHLN